MNNNSGMKSKPAKLPAPVIQEVDGFMVLRDDALPGGTKRRALAAVLRKIAAKNNVTEFVYPSTAYGYGPLALAFAAADAGIPARLIYSWRKKKNWTPMMTAAKEQGAVMHILSHRAYFNVVTLRAQTYCAKHSGAYLMPMGFDTEDFRAELLNVAQSLKINPKEVWYAAGSGTLARVLQQAWPDAKHHAVIVGKQDIDTGSAKRHVVDLAFEKAAKNPPPFPSAPSYDAKVWDVMQRRAKRGAFFWNVAG